jgi:dipeptidyl aminopeptidase/acylaminoacyl peptidase
MLVSDKSGIFQLYAVDRMSGAISQVTDDKGGVPFFNVALSPNGRFFHYLQDTKGDEKGHVVRRSCAGGPPEDITPDLPPYNLRGIGFAANNRRMALTIVTEAGYHVYSLDLNEQDQVQKQRLLYQDKMEFWQAELSADGALTAVRSTRRTGSRLYCVVVFDAVTGEEVAELWDGPEASITPTCFSPLAGDDRILGVSSKSGQKRPYLWHPRTQERTNLDFPDMEGDVLAWDWSPDGQTLLLCHSHWAQQQLYTYDLPSNTLTKLEHPSGTYDLSVGPFGSFPHFLPDGTIVSLWQNGANPMQVVELDGRTGSRKRILFGSENVPAGRPWRSVTFTSSDGTPFQGWLVTPEGPGPFSTVLNMHGGPHMAITETFSPPAQSWVNHGFAFCTINYRGSTGFGDAFKSQIWGNLGHFELMDMVAARDWLVEQKIARPDAIFLNGGSYGGYLTLWGLARRPDLWAGGIAIVAIADWVTNYEDAADAMKGAFAVWHAGHLADVQQNYVKSSPITYIENIQAPLLIFQGFNDSRTTARQMEQFVAKMEALGKPVEIHWFDAGHGKLDKSSVTDDQARAIQFALNVIAKKEASVG